MDLILRLVMLVQSPCTAIICSSGMLGLPLGCAISLRQAYYHIHSRPDIQWSCILFAPYYTTQNDGEATKAGQGVFFGAEKIKQLDLS